ncbi:hypothetical protein HispidOSU_023799 [Sigmodon hispidus]
MHTFSIPYLTPVPRLKGGEMDAKVLLREIRPSRNYTSLQVPQQGKECKQQSETDLAWKREETGAEQGAQLDWKAANERSSLRHG